MICGAKTKTGPPCQKPPCRNSRRCRLHGGAEGSGRPIVHGRYSRFREFLGDRWDHVANDPTLYRFDMDLAAFLAYESELMPRLEPGDAPRFREEATKKFIAVKFAIARGNAPALQAALDALEKHLLAGHDRDLAWDALLQNCERRAALAKTAIDAMTRADNAITVHDLKLFVKLLHETLYHELTTDDADRCSLRLRRELADCVAGSRGKPALPAGVTEPLPLSPEAP